MSREFSADALSVIALTGLGFAPSALADPASPNIPVLARSIVLTGDHAGPGTLGLDTDIDAHQRNGVGNQDLFSDDLRDLAGNVAGRTSSVCITTSPFTGDPNRPLPQRGANLCTTGYALTDGKITMSGIVTDDDFKPGVLSIPIAGGTGKYRGAKGQLDVKFAPVFTDPATLTFHLSTLPFPLKRLERCPGHSG